MSSMEGAEVVNEEPAHNMTKKLARKVLMKM
jgi:hypothetical protein